MTTNRKKSLASIVITLAIIATLILSQPALSLIVSLTGPDKGIVGEIVTFTAKIEIQSSAGEWTYIKDIRLRVVEPLISLALLSKIGHGVLNPCLHWQKHSP